MTLMTPQKNDLMVDWSMEVLLPPKTKITLMSVCHRFQKGISAVSMDDLTKDTSLTPNQVKTALTSLMEAGLITQLPAIHMDGKMVFQIDVEKGVLFHHQQEDPQTGEVVIKNRWNRENLHELQNGGLGI